MDQAEHEMVLQCSGNGRAMYPDIPGMQWNQGGSANVLFTGVPLSAVLERHGVGVPDYKDPLVGANDGTTQFTIPRRPIRRRLTDLPAFVVNRGGEYCFIPGLSALRWLAELDT